MAKKTVEDVNVNGKRVLVRVDFNVPINDKCEITDDTRIRAALPTISYLLEKDAKLVLMSHMGRPKGKLVDRLKMDPVAKRLAQLIGKQVVKVDECIGDTARAAVDNLQPGEVVLLENVRFYEGETSNDETFARQLAEHGEIYVNDAFGTAHRAHASTHGVARYLPGVAGFLLEKEIIMLGKVVRQPEKPFIAIIGGAKVSDKIGVLGNLLDKVDALIIGGGMANTFLKAKGYNTGNSLLEPDKVDLARDIITKAGEKDVDLVLPVDLVVAPAIEPGVETRIVSASEIPEGWMALDIGPNTIEAIGDKVKDAATVVWNGPMGVFEMEPFDRGTMVVAGFLADSSAVTIVGGGDSGAAVKKSGVAERITHISTGGGASLEFLEGKILPGIDVLQDK